MTNDRDEFGGMSTENTPLLFPAIRPSFNYLNDIKNPNHSDYHVEGNGEIPSEKAKLVQGLKTNKGCHRYTGIFLAICASFLLSLTTLLAKVLIQYHPFNEAMWRFQGILIPSLPMLCWAKFGKSEDVFQSIYPLWEADKLKKFLVLFVS